MGSHANFLDQVGRIIELVDAHPRRAVIAVPAILAIALTALIFWQAPALIDIYEARTNRDYERRILREDRIRQVEEHAMEVDELVRGRLLQLRLRSSASRAVIRALVFDVDRTEQIVGIVDVFESMDIRTEETGIRDRSLPLPAFQRTLNYMLASDVPRCIARNVEDYEDPELKAFMHAGNLKASVACPLRSLDGKPIGLLAVSIRTPLSDNQLVVPMTRDAALELGAVLSESAAFEAVIMRKMEKE
ncbi:MAG: hypothetical protein ABJP48_11710 [Erythrobacter sp.]